MPSGQLADGTQIDGVGQPARRDPARPELFVGAHDREADDLRAGPRARRDGHAGRAGHRPRRRAATTGSRPSCSVSCTVRRSSMRTAPERAADAQVGASEPSAPGRQADVRHEEAPAPASVPAGNGRRSLRCRCSTRWCRPSRPLARAQAAPRTRFGAIYVPNGAIMEQWIPDTVGGGLRADADPQADRGVHGPAGRRSAT